MKSVFDVPVREELINRISAIGPKNNALWGKMNLSQMLRHCSRCEDMFQGKIRLQRVFIGRLIGKMVLKKVLKDDKPFGKNSPTSPVLKISAGSGDMEQEKKEWINRVRQYADYNNTDFVHPFFGPMTKEQIGFFAYKHADHHLRQFGA